MLGAAGGIGQPLSLLLKDLDAVTELCVAATVRAPRGARGAASREAWRPAAPASPDPQHPLTPSFHPPPGGGPPRAGASMT